MVVLGALFALGGLLIAGWGVQTGLDARSLNADGVRAEARVTDARISEQRSGSSQVRQHQLRYSFAVPGDDATYVAEDDIFFIEQDDVWVELDEEDWERARDAGRIDIEYLEGDPGLNQPVAARRGYVSAAVFTGLGLFAFLLGALLVRGGLRRVTPPVPQATDSTHG